MANKVTLIPQRDMSKHLAQDDEVQKALRSHAHKIMHVAEVLLAIHRKTGSHSIKYEGHTSSIKFGHIDHYVVMEGPAPVSVEFGHRTKNGEWVQGLYIMTRAMFAR
jgi:hypothetical protein